MDLQLLRGLYKDIARDISVGLTEPPAGQGMEDPSFLPYESSHISSLRSVRYDDLQAPGGDHLVAQMT